VITITLKRIKFAHREKARAMSAELNGGVKYWEL
jgi:hypothetical protein